MNKCYENFEQMYNNYESFKRIIIKKFQKNFCKTLRKCGETFEQTVGMLWKMLDIGN